MGPSEVQINQGIALTYAQINLSQIQHLYLDNVNLSKADEFLLCFNCLNTLAL